MKESDQRVALIAGATGLVGGHCLQSLLSNNYYKKVIALSRRPLVLAHDKLECRIVDFGHLEDEGDNLYCDNLYCDDVFCCLGTTMKQAGSEVNFRKVDFEFGYALAKLGKRAGAAHFLLVSAIGANVKSPVFYSRVKGELEQAVDRLGYDRVSIFQPSFLAGIRKDTRKAETMGINLTLALSSMLVGPFADYSVIKAEDLAAAMVSIALADTRPKGRIVQRLKYRKIMKSLSD